MQYFITLTATETHRCFPTLLWGGLTEKIQKLFVCSTNICCQILEVQIFGKFLSLFMKGLSTENEISTVQLDDRSIRRLCN